MAQLEDENQKVTNSVIPNQTEAKAMRNLIENKGLLNGKGKLYAGTDDTTSTGAPVTTAIDPSNAADGSVLIKDSSQAGGWKVDKVSKDNIKDAAITPEKLDPTQYYGFKDSVTVAENLQSLDNGASAIFKYNSIEYSSGDNTSNVYNGTLEFPQRQMSSNIETIATEEEIKRQIESGKIVAQIAQTTDFSNAEWTRIDGEGKASVVEGGVYQIRTEANNYNYIEGIVTMKKPSTASLSTVRLGVYFRRSGSSVLLIDEYVVEFDHNERTMSMSVIITNVNLSTPSITLVGSLPLTTYWEYRRLR